MAWQSDILNPLTIITGDGKTFTVAWVPDGRVEEYNLATFEFNNLPGSLIVKSQPKGRKIPFKFFFQGDNYISDANDFLKSAANTNPWTVNHPLYGTIICHVAGLNFDDSKYNVSEVSCTLLETIQSDGTLFSDNPIDKISADKAANDGNFLAAFTVTPSVKDVNTLTATNNQLYAKGLKLGGLSSYFNAFKAANAAVLNATSQPALAMRATQALINQPASFSNGVKDRMGALSAQFTTLRTSISTQITRSAKKIYELQGGCIISAMALAASTPTSTDYPSSTDVLFVIGQLLDNYNNYITDLDSLQTANGGLPTSYIPDPTSIIGLNALISYTVSQLFAIALGAKQERSIYLENDSNWILLAHRFYGISADDSELILLMNQNNVGLNEVLEVKKGRKIIYYV
jgi:hypothetical protein